MANRSTEDLECVHLEDEPENGTSGDRRTDDHIGTSEGTDRPGTTDTGDSDDGAHLEDVPVGAGCTELWEHLAARREATPIEDDSRTDQDERATE